MCHNFLRYLTIAVLLFLTGINTFAFDGDEGFLPIGIKVYSCTINTGLPFFGKMLPAFVEVEKNQLLCCPSPWGKILEFDPYGRSFMDK